MRIIRNNRQILSYRDAQGFRMNGVEKLRVKPANALVYHYGWVKSPTQMKRKQMEAGRYWASDDLLKQEAQVADHFDFSSFDSLQKFRGRHPQVMLKRIKEQNWQVEIDVTQKRFTLKEKLLYWIEKKTGKRLFNFSNYKLIS